MCHRGPSSKRWRGMDWNSTGSFRDFLGFLNSQVADLASPPPLAKCLGATFAGSLFALAGMALEGLRNRSREKASPTGMSPACRARGQTSPGSTQFAEAELVPKSGAMPGPCSSTGSRPTSPERNWRPSPSTFLGAARGGCRTAVNTRISDRELSEADRVERQVKSILNKLTRERFDKLYAQLLECFVQTEKREESIAVVAREVFAKATMQHNYVEMYADVCSKLTEDLERHGVKAIFRHALLDQCQKSFNQYLDPPRIDSALDYDEQYEELVKYKTRMLGNVRLIGHLLIRRMLSAKIIFHCTDELLSIGSPEALETLCVFLETIGPSFNSPRWQGHARLEGVFMRVECLAEDPKQCLRTRCLFKDLLDQRRNRWREHKPKVLERGASGRS
eukprot:CAMPEP_0117513852 /NCGR_PEP_ID=MMETSP0784-20121206/29768_1 /TAXON_ID=39447 /ORGANISM="" /LENGTH=391 /DNA_ID=CAMNT_0005309631 /DNA_START=127 /DNA_END=1302 /DNA_ORIENTATION=-